MASSNPIHGLGRHFGRAVAWLALTLAVGAAHAQVLPNSLDPTLAITQYVHSNRGVEHGLPQSSVYAVLQSRSGYLWLGTQEGLARFDGNRFVVYDRASYDGLLSNEVRAIVEDDAGGLWLGTNGGGISLLRDGAFTTYTSENGLPSDLVRSLHLDPDGTLWIGMIDGGLASFDGRSFTSYSPDDGLPGNVVLAITRDAGGTLWIGTEGGLARMANGSIEPYTNHSLAASLIWDLQPDEDGSVWVGTDAGLLRIEGDTVRAYTTADGLCSSSVSSIHRDAIGTLWLGTLHGGLCRMRGDSFDGFSAGQSLSHDRVRALAQDEEGNLWIGTEGGGLDQLRTGRFTPLSTPEGLSGEVVFSVLEDRDGTLWVGTEGGGLNRVSGGTVDHYTRANGLPSNDVYALHEDRDGGVWIGMYGGGICHLENGRFRCFDDGDGLSNNNVYAISQDRRGTVWIGTEAGLNLYRDGTISLFAGDETLEVGAIGAIEPAADGGMWIGTYGAGLRFVQSDTTTYITRNEGLSSDIVLALHEDDQGALWIGTQGGGLCRYSGESVACAGSSDGLLNDNVLQILDDGRGRLWLGSNRGISRIKKDDFEAFASGRTSTLTAVNYGRHDGLRSPEMSGGTQPSAWRGRDGRLWFATVDGVASIDPTRELRNQIPPPMVIELVTAGEKALPTATAHKIAPGRRDLTFQYTALTFAADEKARFMYRLEGYDDHWIEAGSRREAFYTALPPGEYVFRVKAANADGVWNETAAEVGIHLRPWFYETTWFLGLCLLIVAGAAFAIHRGRIAHLKARERELEQVVDERTRDLRLEKEKTEEAKNVIEAQAEKLRELDRFKTRFFANVSHEFRTPLTMIVGPLENALSGGYGTLPDRMQRQVEIMLRNAMRLLRLINQLLDLSKLEAGKMTLQAAPRNIVAFLEGVVMSCTAFAEQKQINLTFQSTTGEAELFYEPDKLEKVFYNLLSNAVKFTPAGGTISVRLSEIEAGPDLPEGGISIEVEDSGRGIPAHQIDRVFDRFHQVDGSNTREHEGTGIGLSLVRELVLLHRGTIDVRSEAGQGTTFTVVLPCGRGHLTDEEITTDDLAEAQIRETMSELASSAFDYMHAEDAPAASEPSTRREDAPLVLVADDNKDVREYVAGLLEECYRVEVAADGVEALERARSIVPDLVISDVMMPRMDGNELCREIKSDEALAHVPVILVTARATHDGLIEGLEGGADDYLAKPFNARELLTRVENLLRLRRQEKQLKEMNDGLEQKVREQVDVILEQREHYERELVEARDRAEASERLKSAILDNMNHELRTPLTAILGYSAIIRKEAPDELREFAMEISRNSSRLMSTLDALLHLSRLEAEAGSHAVEEFDLAEITRNVMREFDPAAKAKSLRMTLQIDSPTYVGGDGALAPPNETVPVESNRTAVEQALRHLVDNAVKFTESGAVRIRISEDGGHARVHVQDTGPGISATFLPRVFDAFTQESEGLTRTHQGVGLGLTVAKRLVNLAGGEIEVESVHTKGSTFTLTLPRHAVA